MKKSTFKKAGAAVLSMAMLLSMGAVTLPVYADNTIGKSTTSGDYAPAQVEITIAKSGTGISGGNAQGDGTTSNQNDANHSYDYLKDVTKATVNLYRVATLSGSGWAWDTKLATELADNNPDVVDEFDKLLAKVTASDNTEVPNEDSTTLQSLASKLERIIYNRNQTTPGTFTSLATDTITKKSDGTFTTASLPLDDDLFGGKTQNVNGYYLIIADSDDAGTVMQPVLVHLKNGKIDGNAYKVKLSLKGNNIGIDKTIEKVETKVDDKDAVVTKDGDISRVLTDNGDVATTKKTAVVSGHDIVTYQIHTETPDYDPLLDPTQIEAYTITDTPDKGINVIGYEDATNGYMTPRKTTDANKNGKIKVYFSADDTLILPGEAGSGETADIPLTEGQDYTITENTVTTQVAGNTVSSSTGAGFVVTITGSQLRGLNADGTVNTSSALSSTTTDTMEKGHIFVVFEAETTDELDTLYRDDLVLLDDADINHANFTKEALWNAKTTLGTNRAEIEKLAKEFNEKYGTDADNKLTEIKKIVKVRVEVAEEASEADIYNTDTTDNVPAFIFGTDEPWHETSNLELKAYAMYVLKALQTTIDADNKATKEAAETAGNLKSEDGTKNTATLAYGNKYATGKNKLELSSDTTVYSVNLDLTKVVIDNNIAADTTVDDLDKPLYVLASDETKTTDDAKLAKKDNGKIIYQDKSDASKWTSDKKNQAKTQITYVYLDTTSTEGAADSKYTLNQSESKKRTDGYDNHQFDSTGTNNQFNNNSDVYIAAPKTYNADGTLKTDYTYDEFIAIADTLDLTATTVLQSQAIKITDAPIYVKDKANLSTATSLDKDDATTDGGNLYRITVEGQKTLLPELGEKTSDNRPIYIDAYAGANFGVNDADHNLDVDVATTNPKSPFYRTTDINRALKDSEGNPYYYSKEGLVAPADSEAALVKQTTATDEKVYVEAVSGTLAVGATVTTATENTQIALRDGGDPVQATDADGKKLYQKKTNQYKDNTTHTPVQGAVFELTEVHDNETKASATDTTHSRGKAVTTSDGKLVMLEADQTFTSEADANAVLTDINGSSRATEKQGKISAGDVVYVEKVQTSTDGEGNPVYGWVTYKATDDNAWTLLSAGTYQLEELYAPTGFKTWGEAVEFTITAPTKENNYYGAFAGSSEADVFVGQNGTKASSTNPAVFTVTNGTVKINGTEYKGTVLQNEITNEYDDALPATGGMGTVLFTAGGIAIVLMAGAMFVVYMKKRETEEE